MASADWTVPASDAQTLALLDGFIQAIRRQEPSEEAFHRVIEVVFAIGERLHRAIPLDPALLTALTNLRNLQMEQILPSSAPQGRRVGKRQQVTIGGIPLDRIEQWLDTIRSTLASLLDGDAPHASLIAYCHYLQDHGPGSDTAWFVRLAIQAVQDERIIGATSPAATLARLGAGEALPALRQAMQRDYRDQKVLAEAAGPLKQWTLMREQAFDAEIKRSLRDAIANLEKVPPTRRT